MVSSSSASFDSTQVKNTLNNTIKKKISKGRQKIEIKKIEAKDSRLVTFSKRRTGLFKKAAELCVLTGAKIAILVNSPGGKVYVFDEYDLIDFYLNNMNDVVETGQLGFPTNEFSECYGDVSQEMITSSSSNSEEELVDGMDIGQLEEYVCSLEEMKKDAVTKADELKMNSNLPAMLGSEEMGKTEVVEASDSVVIDNSEAMFDSDLPLDMSWLDMLGSEEMKKDEVVEASDSVVINNSEAMLGSDLPLDMSWLDLDLLDMSWIDSYTDHFDTNMNMNDAFNLNFHHGVKV